MNFQIHGISLIIFTKIRRIPSLLQLFITATGPQGGVHCHSGAHYSLGAHCAIFCSPLRMRRGADAEKQISERKIWRRRS